MEDRDPAANDDTFETQILACNENDLGHFSSADPSRPFSGGWDVELSHTSKGATNLYTAVEDLRSGLPVAFPTETVYGLGADATNATAVRAIYKAKQRPSDNPLIVHISSLAQLRRLWQSPNAESDTSSSLSSDEDPIPPIYHELIEKYWPGPLTILLPLPNPSPFVPEVSNNLPTVGIRMPSAKLALALINISNLPLAAPSANASGKPSPTTAAHVLHDLNGRIKTILDGGSCDVGLESTVVDGLSKPPLILRPGAISLEMLRECPGWEDVQVGYENTKVEADGTQPGSSISPSLSSSPSMSATAPPPRAPGMKYRHYSPKARVIITRGRPSVNAVQRFVDPSTSNIGILRTSQPANAIDGVNGRPINPAIDAETAQKPQDTALTAISSTISAQTSQSPPQRSENIPNPPITTTDQLIHNTTYHQTSSLQPQSQPSPSSTTSLTDNTTPHPLKIYTINLGPSPHAVARNLFSGLRELDLKGVDVIFVEGMDDRTGDLVAAVMNRLGKAAEREVGIE